MESSSPSSSFVDFWDELDTDAVVIGHDDVRDFNPENILPKSNDVMESVRKWIGPTEYDGDRSEYQAHLLSHHPGTGGWVFDSEPYRQWHDGQDHGILWVRGVPGAGKSVLASSLISHLQHEQFPVLYFFFRHTFDTHNSPEALLRDWLAQVLKYSPPLQHVLSQTLALATTNLSLAELWRFLRRALMHLPKVYCVIDALDEMDSDGLEPFVRSLDALGRWRPAEVKLVVTSRSMASIDKILSRGVVTLDIRLDKKRVEDDIASYVKHRLSTSSLPPESHPEIKKTILQRADGLFLYAKLALDAVFEHDSDVPPANLDEMPVDLTAMYTNLLREHARKTTGIPDGLQQSVLQLVTHATRTLRLLEVADFIRFTLQQDDIGKMKGFIRSLCGPLLEILPDETVRIVHHSLTEYVTGKTNTSDASERVFPVFSFGATHHQLATRCLSYLASGVLNRVKFKKRREISGDVNYTEPAVLDAHQVLPPFTRYAGTSWVFHVRKAISAGHDQSQVNELLDELLVEPNLDQVDVLIGTRMDFQPTPLHFAIGLELQDYTRHLLTHKRSIYMREDRLDDSLICYSATKGSDVMTKLLLDHGARLTAHNQRGRTPLHIAVEQDHASVAAVLIDAGADPDVSRENDNFYGMPGEEESPWTPLERAFTRGSPEMAKVFTSRLKSSKTVTKAFYKAVSARNSHAIELLLHHPELDVNEPYQQITPLFAACQNRDVDTMELLLKSGCKVNAAVMKSENPELSRIRAVPAFEDAELNDMDFDSGIYSNKHGFSNVLHAWARGRGSYEAYDPNERRKPAEPDHETMARAVSMLLAHGADVHQVNEKGETPLHLANDVVSVRSLLDGGADPNAVNGAGETLLHICKDKGILDILLPKADLEIKSRYTQRTPLLSVLVDGYRMTKERVEKAVWLIDNGADVNTTDKYGNTALHLAVGMDDIQKCGIPLLENLCSSGADVNAKNHDGKTPLHMNAAGSGRVSSIGYDSGQFVNEVLNILLKAGADINARDNSGRTVLFQSTENGQYTGEKHVSSFETMVQAGADASTVDAKGRTLLHAHIHNFNIEPLFIEHMVKYGLDPTQVDAEGNTLLHEIAPKFAKSVPRTQSGKLVIRLIEMGIDPARTNNIGRTPMHILASIHPGPFDPSNSTSSYPGGYRPTNHDDECGFDTYLRLCPRVVDLADRHGIRPLHFASTFSEYMTRRLLEEGASPSQPTKEGLTPLHTAARSRQANTIGILLDKLKAALPLDALTAVLDARDQAGRSVLYYAAASGCVESFRLLVDAGATLNHNSYTGSPWQGCADFEEEVTKWPQEGARDNAIFQRKTWNHIDTNAGAVKLLEPARPQPQQDTYRNFQKPEFPAERLDDILEVLTRATSKDQLSFVDEAIAFATEKGHHYAVECLLQARKRLTGDAKHILDGKTQACLDLRQGSLQLNSSNDREGVIHLMQSRHYSAVGEKLTPDVCLARPKNGSAWDSVSLASQLVSGGFSHLVAKAASEEVISSTEWREGNKLKDEQRPFGVQPLLVTACSREMPNMDVIRTLVEDVKVNVNGRVSRPGENGRPTGLTALHCLAQGEHWWQTAQGIPYLVSHGADVNAVEEENGLTPLGYALRTINGSHFSRRTVETLLALGASPNGADRFGSSYLSWTTKHPEIFQLLIQHGAVANRPTLVAAITQRNLDLVQMLLSNGANPNDRKVGQERPEIQYSENSFSPERNDPASQDELYLLDWMAGDIYRRKESDGETERQIFKLLLDHGADPFAPYLRTTVLHRVMENRGLGNYVFGQNGALDLLLDHPGLDFNTRDADGMTLLLLAARRDSISDESAKTVIQKLIDRGADIYARDNKDRSALHYASRTKDRFDFILGKVPELLDLPDFEGKTPLHHALGHLSHWGRNDPSMVYSLIAAGADVTHPDHNGKTALHIALADSSWRIHEDGSVRGSGRDMFDRLVGKGADVNARTSTGEPPIFAYVRSGQLSADTDLSQLGPRPKKGQTDVEWNSAKDRLERAAAVKREDAVWAYFEQQGVDLQAVNDAGEGLLHLIAQEPRGSHYEDQYRGIGVARFKTLMARGLDPAMEDRQHRTPLDLAASFGKEDILALFKAEDE